MEYFSFLKGDDLLKKMQLLLSLSYNLYQYISMFSTIFNWSVQEYRELLLSP